MRTALGTSGHSLLTVPHPMPTCRLSPVRVVKCLKRDHHLWQQPHNELFVSYFWDYLSISTMKLLFLLLCLLASLILTSTLPHRPGTLALLDFNNSSLAGSFATPA